MGPWCMQTTSSDVNFPEDMDWEASAAGEEERPILDLVQENAHFSTSDFTEMDWSPVEHSGKKRKRQSPLITLVLDLDETLVHSTLTKERVHVERRPHLQMFMERVAQLFEIIVFTAGTRSYANQVLNVLDPERRLIQHRLFRDSCVRDGGIYVKDLRIFGRYLSQIAIVENSPKAYGLQVENGIPIESWYEDRSDTALVELLPFLETLAGVDDVRPVIANRFNQSSGKVAAASK